MQKKPEVCVLPVAGLSTRNLPTTKVLHKGFLTLDSLPIIQYAVDACKEIGIKEIVFIYSTPSCQELYQNYYTPNKELEANLARGGKDDLLALVKNIIPDGMTFSFAEQSEPKGNGHAVLMAKEIIGDRDFVVMWVDDVYIPQKGGKGVLAQLLEVYEKEGGMVENVARLPREVLTRYGVLAEVISQEGKVVRAKSKMEKPPADAIPSDFASFGPYILPNKILDILPEVKKGTNGEINLADAQGLLALRGEKLTGVVCDTIRFDCGTNEELAKSNIKLSIMRNPSLKKYCKEILEELE